MWGVLAQCAHAALGAYKAGVRDQPDLVRRWRLSGETKIAVKANTLSDLYVVTWTARRA